MYLPDDKGHLCICKYSYIYFHEEYINISLIAFNEKQAIEIWHGLHLHNITKVDNQQVPYLLTWCLTQKSYWLARHCKLKIWIQLSTKYVLIIIYCLNKPIFYQMLEIICEISSKFFGHFEAQIMNRTDISTPTKLNLKSTIFYIWEAADWHISSIDRQNEKTRQFSPQNQKKNTSAKKWRIKIKPHLLKHGQVWYVDEGNIFSP